MKIIEGKTIDITKGIKQEFIEKACEWLAKYLTGIRGKEFIEDFKKAMEDEL